MIQERDVPRDAAAGASPSIQGAQRPGFFRRQGESPALSAEEQVSKLLSRFSQSRRALARTLAQRKGVPVPDEVERFFDALDRGDWAEIDAQGKALSQRSGQYEGSTHSPELDPVWQAVLDAYGVAEQAHEWPAQKLLDYGNAILDTLRPGMVYVGGTDSGRWIPELLNESRDGEPHVILTQNALVDSRYVDYMETLYGDRIHTLTEDDTKRAFDAYVADARQRLEHDTQFPDQPRQVRPGEDVRLVDGKVEVGGQVAVMDINERMLQALMAKNPDLDFALQESSPLQKTYADALPLGPLMELSARDEGNTFTPERASQSLDYWRNRVDQILSDPEAVASTAAVKAYSHDAVSAANFLAGHQHTAEAEEAYRLAAKLWPGNPESLSGQVTLLAHTGREEEARRLVAQFNQDFPEQKKSYEEVQSAARLILPGPPKTP